MLLRILQILPLILAVALSACSSSGQPEAQTQDKLNVVATTSIVGDVVKNISGDAIDLHVLIPPGNDPHNFDPRPQDIAALSDAQVVFINGLGLEEALEPALEANVQGSLVDVSKGIDVLPFLGKHEGEGLEHATGDPHTWMDPNNVVLWVQNIASALSEVDPANAGLYQTNATSYITELRDLDTWIRQQVEQIPPGQRMLVTDHSILGYFADEYGFKQVGLVVPALSTNATPSAQELAALEDEIRKNGVPAILVGSTVNPALAEQVAHDTGVKLVSIYTGSLSETGSEVDSYINFMHYNIRAIVDALK